MPLAGARVPLGGAARPLDVATFPLGGATCPLDAAPQPDRERRAAWWRPLGGIRGPYGPFESAASVARSWPICGRG